MEYKATIGDASGMDTSAKPTPPPLPKGLPVPVDDGLARHLPGRPLPELAFQSTDGPRINVTELADDKFVLYVFPKMGPPDEDDPPGWDQIPGARGCTQQSCAFRDHQAEFDALGYAVAGLSAQPTEEQQEAASRLHLTVPLLADPDCQLGAALDLPTFEVAGRRLYKRLTLVAHQSRIVRVFYPVFPPDENAEEVLSWIREEGSRD